MTGTRTRDVRGRTRHGVTGAMLAAMLATLMLAGQAGAQVDGCDWTDSVFWDGAALPDVERCIAAGAEIEAGTLLIEGTPLHWAVRFGTAEAVQALIAAGADVNARILFSRTTPLHWAAYGGTAESVQALIDARADIAGRGPKTEGPRCTGPSHRRLWRP